MQYFVALWESECGILMEKDFRKSYLCFWILNVRACAYVRSHADNGNAHKLLHRSLNEFPVSSFIFKEYPIIMYTNLCWLRLVLFCSPYRIRYICMYISIIDISIICRLIKVPLHVLHISFICWCGCVGTYINMTKPFVSELYLIVSFLGGCNLITLLLLHEAYFRLKSVTHTKHVFLSRD